MAKSKRERRDSSDIDTIAIQRMVLPAAPVTLYVPQHDWDYEQIRTHGFTGSTPGGHLRGYVPEWDDPPARNVNGTKTRYRHDSFGDTFRRASSFGRAVVAFANNPLNPVIHCLRRKTRREVLFALRPKRRGRGAGRRKWHSNYGC